MQSLKIKIKPRELGIVFLLIVPCITFILEEMVSNDTQSTYIRATGLMLVFLILSILLNGRIKTTRLAYSWIWILYITAVCISVLQRNTKISLIMDVLIILLVVLKIVISQDEVGKYEIGCKMLCIFGIANCAGVLMQFILSNTYNNTYFNLFTSSWREYALSYFNNGYLTGLQAVPGDAAGLIVFAIGIIVCYCFLCKYYRKKNKKKALIALIVLLFALLLTGKKGVLIAGILSIVLIYLLLTAQKKQWVKIITFAIFAPIIYILVRNFIVQHADIQIFYRLGQFFEQLSSGDSSRATTGRTKLYSYALLLWKKHFWFGIGWRNFRDVSSGVLSDNNKHDVNLDYLQFLCECGTVGFMLIISPIVLTLGRTVVLVRSVLKRKLEMKEQWIILSVAFIQFFIIIYAFLEIPFFDRVFFVVYAFSCIVINNAYRELKLNVVIRRGYET